jgi:spermidine synthase
MNLLRLQTEFRDQTAQNIKHHSHSLSLSLSSFTNIETVFYHISTYARFLTWLANKSEIFISLSTNKKETQKRKRERKKKKEKRT